MNDLEKNSLLADLAADLADARDSIEPDFVDVRIRYHDGEWSFHVGDSSYDQDHRGAWGASSVAINDDDDALDSIAAELLEQALEDLAEQGEPEPVAY